MELRSLTEIRSAELQPVTTLNLLAVLVGELPCLADRRKDGILQDSFKRSFRKLVRSLEATSFLVNLKLCFVPLYVIPHSTIDVDIDALEAKVAFIDALVRPASNGKSKWKKESSLADQVRSLLAGQGPGRSAMLGPDAGHAGRRVEAMAERVNELLISHLQWQDCRITKVSRPHFSHLLVLR